MGDGTTQGHTQSLPEETDAQEGAYSLLAALDWDGVTDKGIGDRHDRCREDPSDGPVEGEVEKAQSKGAQAGANSEESHREGNDLPFSIPVGERTKEKLEKPEWQHVGGDDKSCPDRFDLQ